MPKIEVARMHNKHGSRVFLPWCRFKKKEKACGLTLNRYSTVTRATGYIKRHILWPGRKMYTYTILPLEGFKNKQNIEVARMHNKKIPSVLSPWCRFKRK